MAEITMDREAYEKLRGGDHRMVGSDSKIASFLVNKFEEGQAEALSDDPTWIYNIWTYRFG
jgi:hypothetical protein